MPAEPTQAKLKRRSSRKDLDDYRFDGSHARELEQKRNRGEVSCAECRRLKIKCDKQIPCQSCQRRGCAALCPNGSLSTGQGTRFVLAATEHLHRRISGLSGRIRQLEDALSVLQSKHSTEPHPLLHEDLIKSIEDDDMGGVEEGGSGHAQIAGHGDVIDAFGTLSISDHGISRFFGPTGGSESLLLANLNASPHPGSSSSSSPLHASPHTTTSLSRGSISPLTTAPALASSSSLSTALLSQTSAGELALFSSSFPFTPLGAPPAVHELIASHLPPYSIASALVEMYFAQCSWIFHGVTRAQVIDDMLPAVYGPDAAADASGVNGGEYDVEDDANEGRAKGGGEDYSGPHDLALLFAVFAIGALVRPEPVSLPASPPNGVSSSSSPSSSNASPRSLSSPPLLSTAGNNALGEHFHQVARAALALQPVLEKPSIVTIQTLHLMSIYNAMSGSDLRSETSMEMTWSLITLAAHLSQTIGLHRDSARWGLSPKMVQRRRILFWDLFVADVWQSLNTGRPPSFSLAYIDCSFPDAKDGKGEGGEAGFGSAFSTWQCRFAAECVADVTARTLTAEAPSYATIMELDKKVREFPLPEGMGPRAANGSSGDKAGKGKCEEEDLAVSFQRCVLDHIRETVLMYIHRSFFAQAIIEQPINPLKSAYAPSFLAAYRASSTILKSIREQFGIWPNSCARFWTMWTFAFSAAVVFGTVVTRGPRSPLAQSAMAELEQACILFSKASVYSIRATKALPILSKLADKARHALAGAQKDPTPLSEGAGLLWNIKVKREENEDDELAIFAGHTRFVSAKKPAPLPAAPVTTAEISLIHLPPAYPANTQPPPQPHHPQRQQRRDPPGIVNGWSGRSDREESYVSVPPIEEHSSQHLPLPPLHYPYVVSERTHQLETYGNAGDWDDDHILEEEPYQHPQHNYPAPTQTMQLQPPRIVPSQFPAPYPPTQPQALPYPTPQQQQHHQQQHHHQHHQHQSQHQYPTHASHGAQHRVQGFQPYPPPIPQHHQHQHQHLQQPHMQYVSHPQAQQYLGQTHLPNAELADLGLAARDSRLDERWSSFMEDSGLLEGLDFRGR